MGHIQKKNEMSKPPYFKRQIEYTIKSIEEKSKKQLQMTSIRNVSNFQ